jgi:hypothetical protein
MNPFAKIIGSCAVCGGVGICVCQPPDQIVLGVKDTGRPQMKQFKPSDFADHTHSEPNLGEPYVANHVTTATTTPPPMPSWR